MRNVWMLLIITHFIYACEQSIDALSSNAFTIYNHSGIPFTIKYCNSEHPIEKGSSIFVRISDEETIEFQPCYKVKKVLTLNVNQDIIDVTIMPNSRRFPHIGNNAKYKLKKRIRKQS